MSRDGSPLGYVVALFDVMGFESRLEKYGLDEIYSRYMKIVQYIKRNDERNHVLYDMLNFNGPMWTAEGNVICAYDIRAAYASDSILIWANLAWRMVQDKSFEVLKKNSTHPAWGHLSFPVPLRPFFETCAEIICLGIECDLPLRGAVSMGDAILNEKERIFLGSPLVEAARLENKQNCISLSLCNSFKMQQDTINCLLPYTSHLKNDVADSLVYKYAFNWPDYWMSTRNEKDIKMIIQQMAENNNQHEYYINTLKLIEFSVEEKKRTVR